VSGHGRDDQSRPTDDTDRLRQIRERDDDLDRLTAYVRDFARMMTELRGERTLKLDHMQIAPLSAFVLAKKRAAIQLVFRGRIGISVARAPER
jgi:hypothetical protein